MAGTQYASGLGNAKLGAFWMPAISGGGLEPKRIPVVRRLQDLMIAQQKTIPCPVRNTSGMHANPLNLSNAKLRFLCCISCFSSAVT